MSLRKIRARFVPSEAVGDVRTVEVFGETLSEDFSEIEVSDEVFAKLKGNPHIEVQVKKATVVQTLASEPEPDPAPEPQPDAGL